MSHAKSLAIVKNMASNPKEKPFMARSLKPKPCTVERVDQSVIESELKRLEEKGYVALMVCEERLDLIISGLEHLAPDSPEFAKAQEMCADLKQLREGAFGK